MPTSPSPDPPILLGDFPLHSFLGEYFGRRPLFIPGALRNFESPITPSELAGLACETDVESRIVRDTGPQYRSPWRLENGPFEEDHFASLAERDWTLLVQDVDKWHPEVAALLQLVRFLPRWSIDDIMISYATEGGSVGPHVDQYDVFLLQAEGSRRWQVAKTQPNATLRDDTQLKVLKEFQPEEEFLAQPGDVLYLPPGLAHFGVAQEECLTYSFGFRAPSKASLLSALADELVARASGRLEERLNASPQFPSEINEALWKTIAREAQTALEEVLAAPHWFGRHLTEGKSHLPNYGSGAKLSLADLLDGLRSGRVLCRSAAVRFLHVNAPEPTLYAGGEQYVLAGNDGLAFARLICEAEKLDGTNLAPHVKSTDFPLLLQLIEWGALHFEDELDAEF